MLTEKNLPDNSKMVLVRIFLLFILPIRKGELTLFNEPIGTHCTFNTFRGYYERYDCIDFVLEKVIFFYGRPNK